MATNTPLGELNTRGAKPPTHESGWENIDGLLENAVKEAIEESRQVFLVGATGSTEKRLQKLKLLDRLPQSHITGDRLDALRLAVNGLQLNV